MQGWPSRVDLSNGGSWCDAGQEGRVRRQAATDNRKAEEDRREPGRGRMPADYLQPEDGHI